MKTIFTSCYPKDVLEKRGEIYEGMNIIAKPIKPQKLLRNIRSLIDNEKII